MRDPSNDALPLSGGVRIGSLFSGYGGLDLAVEEFFEGHTVWFSEINQPVARVFANHWPDAPNLGDITNIDWSTVEPIDVLCGGFPCQDVSVAGRHAGLAPGTRSGLWSHMAAAIDALQPEFVVIENVRGLLSAMAVRNTPEGDDDAQRTPGPATPTGATTVRGLEPDPWHLGDQPARPLRAAGAILADLADLRYDASWIGLPASSIGAPHQRFRVFILAHRTPANPGRLGLPTRQRDLAASQSEARHDLAHSPARRPRPQRPTRLTEQATRVRDSVAPDRQHLQRWGRYARAIARWEHILGRPVPSPTVLDESPALRPASVFIEWLMGLPEGWVSGVQHRLTPNQQLSALGNGVVNGQVAVPTGGQLKVPAPRGVSTGLESGSSVRSGLSHSVRVAVGDDGVAVVQEPVEHADRGGVLG